MNQIGAHQVESNYRDGEGIRGLTCILMRAYSFIVPIHKLFPERE